MKKQEGITLIALIITIIVMLILVGVTVATISDGGLFQKAKTAAEQTEEKTIYEQLVGTMKLETDGKINVEETYSAAKTALEAQGKTVDLTSPSSAEEIEKEATIKVNGYTYTITTEKIMSGELKFYGYGYYSEKLDVWYYFLENGLACAYLGENFMGVIKYEKYGNKVDLGGDPIFTLSSDYSTLTDYALTEPSSLVRNDANMYKAPTIKDETCKIYENAVYFSETTNDWFYTLWNEEEVITKIVCLYVGEFEHEFDYVSFNDFIEAGAVVSADGKQVTYNGITYTLVE